MYLVFYMEPYDECPICYDILNIDNNINYEDKKDETKIKKKKSRILFNLKYKSKYRTISKPLEIIKLKCQHTFHLDCIYKTNKNSCPLCRQKIIDEDFCKNDHTTNFFYSSTYKKNGTCTICKKKSFRSLLKVI